MHQLTGCSACLHNASMPNILIRNVPPDVHSRLTEAARRRGQSLQQYALNALVQSTHSMTHAETIAWLRMQQGRASDAQVSGPEMVREARVERVQQTYDRLGLEFDADEDFA